MCKKMLNLLVALLACCIFSGYVSAEEKYPDRPIQAIIPYGAGSTTEIGIRLLSEFMQKSSGQPFIVMNKPGGGGGIAGNELFKSKPDGYTVGMLTMGVTTPELLPNPQRFIFKSGDLQPVCQWSGYPWGIYVKDDAPWKSLGEFIEDARKNPNKFRWAHHGKGGAFWLWGNLLIEQTGIKILGIPFEGDGKNMAALLGHHVDVSIGTLSVIWYEQIKAKKVRALAVSLKKKRDPNLPDVPTIEEAGYPIETESYLGIFVPPGTPQKVITELNRYVRKICEDPEFQEGMKKIGLPVLYTDTKDFEEKIKIVGQKHYEVYKKLGAL